ncbi:MAG: HAMP domain-containing sensor histidine kinase [Planctomycetota bacterium]|nr:HAMP domain-containing sensor histidine kinase [Planctomycetota bacterium]
MPLPSPQDERSAPAIGQVDRLSSLLGELRALLDGSRALVEHAKRELTGNASLLARGGARDVERDLNAAVERLDRMVELVHAAMQNATRPIGSPTLARARPVTLGEAVQHAVEVLAPLAAASQVRLSTSMGPSVDSLPAGALYTVILNGVQNAVEAVARQGRAGVVQISARADAPPVGMGYGRDARDWYVLEITDDGDGPPGETTRCFDLGFTTKPRGSGVGLAVARSVVQGMGGTIELARRAEGGAVLRVRFPTAPGVARLMIGGAA